MKNSLENKFSQATLNQLVDKFLLSKSKEYEKSGFSQLSFEKISNDLFAHCEYIFEQMLLEYPHEIVLPVPEDVDESLHYTRKIEAWLKNKFSPSVYVSFPDWLTFRIYKDRWRSVYFKNSNDALLFKLTWF